MHRILVSFVYFVYAFSVLYILFSFLFYFSLFFLFLFYFFRHMRMRVRVSAVDCLIFARNHLVVRALDVREANTRNFWWWQHSRGMSVSALASTHKNFVCENWKSKYFGVARPMNGVRWISLPIINSPRSLFCRLLFLLLTFVLSHLDRCQL